MSTDRERVRRLVDSAAPVPFNLVRDLAGSRGRGRVSQALPALAMSLLTVFVVAAALAIGRFSSQDKGGVVAGRPNSPGAAATPSVGVAPTPSAGAEDTDVPDTVEELYVRVERALGKPGLVYHDTVRMRRGGSLPADTSESRAERWVDATRDLARQHHEDQYRKTRTVLADGQVYNRSNDGMIAGELEAERCYGADAAVSWLLDCLRDAENVRPRVEPGEYDGRRAVVLVRTGEAPGDGSTVEFTEMLYLDADTFLPIAKTMDGSVDDPSVGDVTITRRDEYDPQFLPAGKLPGDFFDPRSIGAGRSPGGGR